MSTDSQLTSRQPGWLACLLPFIVPVLYFALVGALRPTGRLGPPETTPWIDQLVYDDYDFTALALRGLNDGLGRHAGRRDAPNWLSEEEFTEALRTSQQPANQYYLEYPHAALLLFKVPYLFVPLSPEAPAALLDSHYGNIVGHWPSDDEAKLWNRFHVVVTVYMLMMVVLYIGLVTVLAAGYLPNGAFGYCGLLLILPGMLFFGLNRFDVAPALLTALSFACLGRNRFTASAVFLAAGTLIKVYPFFLVPFVMRYLLSTKPARITASWGLAYVVTLASFLAPAMLMWGTKEIAAPYIVQMERKHEGFTIYQCLVGNDQIRDELTGNGLIGRGFRFGTLGLVLVLLLRHPMSDFAGILRRGVVVLIVFMSLSVFYSPQWILWLMPLLLPLVSRQARLGILVAMLDLLTWIQWPVVSNGIQFFDLTPFAVDVVLTVLSHARVVVLGLIIWDVLRTERS